MSTIRAIWASIRHRLEGLAVRVSDEPYVPRPPHPANVPGPFYVEDGCCMACGVWEQVAPDLLAWMPDDEPQCFVKRQPETDPEFVRMMDAMKVGEVDCIRAKGCRPDWEQRLRDAGLGHHIDPPETHAQ